MGLFSKLNAPRASGSSGAPPPYTAGAEAGDSQPEKLSINGRLFMLAADKVKQAYQAGRNDRKMNISAVNKDAAINYEHLLEKLPGVPLNERRLLTIMILNDLKGTPIAGSATQRLAAETFSVGEGKASLLLGGDWTLSRRNSFDCKVGDAIIDLSFQPNAINYDMARTLNKISVGYPAKKSIKDGAPYKHLKFGRPRYAFGLALDIIKKTYAEKQKATSEKHMGDVDNNAIHEYGNIFKSLKFLPVHERESAAVAFIKSLENSRIAGEIYMNLASDIKSLGDGKRVANLGEDWPDNLRESFKEATTRAMMTAAEVNDTADYKMAEALGRLLISSTQEPSNTASRKGKAIAYHGHDDYWI